MRSITSAVAQNSSQLLLQAAQSLPAELQKVRKAPRRARGGGGSVKGKARDLLGVPDQERGSKGVGEPLSPELHTQNTTVQTPQVGTKQPPLHLRELRKERALQAAAPSHKQTPPSS